MKRMNLDYRRDFQWSKIWPNSGFKVLRAKVRLHRKRWSVCEDSYRSMKIRKQMRRMIRCNLLRHKKIYIGIMKFNSTHRSELSGIAERAVRRVEAGTSSILIRSGLPERWWEEAVECPCYLRNIQDSLADGRQNTARKKIGYTIWKTKVVPARFIGYILNAERYWLGDLFIVDAEERKNNPATDIHAKRYKAKKWKKEEFRLSMPPSSDIQKVSLVFAWGSEPAKEGVMHNCFGRGALELESRGGEAKGFHYVPVIPRQRDAHTSILGQGHVPGQAAAKISDSVFWNSSLGVLASF